MYRSNGWNIDMLDAFLGLNLRINLGSSSSYSKN